MIKPLGVLLVLGFVGALILCLPFVLWRLVHNVRIGSRKAAALWGIVALAMVMSSAWTVYSVAPKGARTIARMELLDGHAFVVRHYRYGWFEYPKVRFYARDTDGTWTSFAIISELVNLRSSSLNLDESTQSVEFLPAGWYSIPNNDFINIDGSRGDTWQLPPGVEPDQVDHAEPGSEASH